MRGLKIAESLTEFNFRIQALTVKRAKKPKQQKRRR